MTVTFPDSLNVMGINFIGGPFTATAKVTVE
jgi:hypothetical protein